MKSSGIGGQAVLEGVMMKNKNQYAVAVRKPDGDIAVDTKEFKGASEKYPFLKLPIVRGVVAFIESLMIGIKTLTFSASFYEEEEEIKKETESKKSGEGFSNFLIVFTSVLLAVGVFIVLPYYASQFLGKKIDSQTILSLFEGLIRIALFVGYVIAISQMKDIKRVFMYHGAEHKTINCIEQGYELTVKNVKRQPVQHKRCGTSFMLIVMFISIIFFMFIRVEAPWLRLLLRLILVPVIAGVSYEFLKLAGRSDSKIVDILSKPGLWMQKLTTKEPDDKMIEVAIQSVEAVFDWRAYLEENAPKKSVRNKKNKKNNKNKTEEKSAVTKKASTKETLTKETNKTTDSNQQTLNKNDLEDELESLDMILDDTEIDSSVLAKQKQDSLKEKVRIAEESVRNSSLEVSSSLEPTEEEDDLILRALDKYFVFSNEDASN
ncbi:DUF1385 domain-containing protein [Clostridium sp. Marseille-P299]|uniref:DUF1385 domain-containing protein n=1 Tax=Clostridium sp. Marseille-P299 TaxID=1805477 RepID=UPI0009ECE551